MRRASICFSTGLCVLLFTAMSAKAGVIVDVQYTSPNGIGPAEPLSFGLSALPAVVNATFLLGPGTVDPGALNFVVNYGLGDVFSAQLPFGDGLWTNLDSFAMTTVSGNVTSLTYQFAPISTPTAVGIIILNFPLSITGTDTASGQSFSYTYTSSTQTLTSVVPEPSSLMLAALGLLSLVLIRRRHRELRAK